MFETDGQSHEAVGDPEFRASLRRQALVGGGRRMGDEALGIAEIVGDAQELERIEERGTQPACRPRPRRRSG